MNASNAVERVAIAGGGSSALAAAIQLSKAGIHVDVFERDAECSALGSGITLQGNVLKAFGQLGIWDACKAAGYPYEGLTLRAPGPGAKVVAELPDIKMGGPDYPATMGMYRPDLAKIMAEAAISNGANIHYSSAVTGFINGEKNVEVEVNGASAGTYDLLIGADGLNSTVREKLGIATKPEPTGMGIWRVFVSRPTEVTQTQLYYGGPAYIAGYTPTGENTMYAILVEEAQDRFDISEEAAVEAMLELSAAYDGPWDSIRQSLKTEDCNINYTKFTAHLVDQPWHRDRVIIIGDAAHTCPPTIAQGAAQAVEDAMVLSELLTSHESLSEELFHQFYDRRLPRIRTVFEASVQLGKWQLEGNQDADSGGLIHATAVKLAEPA